jgi:hypothetical protein
MRSGVHKHPALHIYANGTIVDRPIVGLDADTLPASEATSDVQCELRPG